MPSEEHSAPSVASPGASRYELVYVRWVDSRGVGMRWRHIEDAAEEKPCLVRSIGWLIAEEEGHITIAPHIGDAPDQCCGDMVIPRSAIDVVLWYGKDFGVPLPDAGKDASKKDDEPSYI